MENNRITVDIIYIGKVADVIRSIRYARPDYDLLAEVEEETQQLLEHIRNERETQVQGA